MCVECVVGVCVICIGFVGYDDVVVVVVCVGVHGVVVVCRGCRCYHGVGVGCVIVHVGADGVAADDGCVAFADGVGVFMVSLLFMVSIGVLLSMVMAWVMIVLL